MLTHHHTRSDHPQPVSPRIPRPTQRCTITCSPLIDRRIRQMQTWHASELGTDCNEMLDKLAQFYFSGLVKTRDLRLLLHRRVYKQVLATINEIAAAKKLEE
jgi:hypothetical protein